MSFLQFLIETEADDADLKRVITVFERRLPRLLGSKLYRYGGKGHVIKYSNHDGILYFFSKTHAFEVKFKGAHVLGIHVWEKWTLNNTPDFIINVGELKSDTIIGSIKKLAQLIKSPKAGKYTADELKEELELMEMASRTTADEFYAMLVDKYGEKATTQLTLPQIKDVAQEFDVNIPGYIFKQKIGRGLFNGKPPELEKVEDTSETSSEITVTPFKGGMPMPRDEAKQLAALSREWKSVSGKPTKAEMKDPDTLYGHLAQLVQMACRGTLRSLLIYGGPGTGKTFTIMNVVKDEGFKSGKDFVKISGKATAVSIYQTLFMYRNDGMIIFDDCDSMWGNQDATNILKAALDTSKVREISWSSNNTINVSKMDDEAREDLFSEIDDKLENSPEERIKLPNQFEFTGRIIFISNLTREEFDSAIMSRSAKIDMSMSAENILQRMRSILPTLGGDDVALDRKEALLDHLIKMNKEGDLETVTMREFVKGLNIVRSGAENWKELLVYA